VSEPQVAFVLGGGGVLGAAEVGMLGALVEAGIRPDLVLGTSIGAINGAAFAADPGPAAVERLEAWWSGDAAEHAFGGGLVGRVRTLARTQTHLHENHGLRTLLERVLPGRFEDLAVPFQCVAASIERATARWFSGGPLIDAVLASCAVPGLLPAVRVGGEHFLDGGLVNSIPVDRAIELGARDVYVLQVGRIEAPLRVPRRPWEVGLVAFEIARRQRFAEALERVPPGVRVHVLPTGSAPVRFDDPGQLRYRDARDAAERVARAREATREHLAVERGGPD
jgi:NTE family protein